MNDFTCLIFLDCETGGLNPHPPQNAEPWEVAAIVRYVNADLDPVVRDHEYVWQLAIDVGNADPTALAIGRYHERHVDGADFPLTTFARDFQSLTAGAYLVGAVPSFDAAFLAALLRRHDLEPAWKHRLICVETYYAGRYAGLPAGLRDAAECFGIDVADHHTAMGDARLARDVFDAVRRDKRGDDEYQDRLAAKARLA